MGGVPVLEPDLCMNNGRVRKCEENEYAWTDLYASGCHVELFCEVRAHNAIRFLVMGESLFKNLQLGLSCPLAMLYLVWDVRVELSEVGERGICAWGADVWNAGIRET